MKRHPSDDELRRRYARRQAEKAFDAGWADERGTASQPHETRSRRDRGPEDWEAGWRLVDQAERGDRG